MSSLNLDINVTHISHLRFQMGQSNIKQICQIIMEAIAMKETNKMHRKIAER